MKVVVTGGSGYFGSLLLGKLLGSGHECINIDLNPINIKTRNLTTIRCDIRDFNKLNKVIGCADVIFHNVAQVPLAKNAHVFDTVNRIGTENILKAAVNNHVPNFVYTSSSAIYGVPSQNPVFEGDMPSPKEAYGLAKLQGEETCQKFHQKYGINVSIIRPRTIMGPGRLGIFSILFDWIERGYNVPVFNGGNNVYQFVHSDDLADATILASAKSGFNAYNIGTEKYGTMREVLSSLCAYAQTGSKVVSLPMSPIVSAMKITSKLNLSPLADYHALMYGRSMYFNTSKAKEQLNWQSNYSNDEMCIETYVWYRKNKSEILSTKNQSQHKMIAKQKILSLVGRLL